MRGALAASVVIGLMVVGRGANAQPAAPASQVAPVPVVAPAATGLSFERERALSDDYLSGRLQKWVGIPLWVVGSARQHRAVRLGYRPHAVAPVLTPTRGGLAAGVRLLSF